MNVWQRARWWQRLTLVVWSVVVIHDAGHADWRLACDAALVLFLSYGFTWQGQELDDLRGQLRALR